jgi:serine phosphatase RsbU (regulator of sigma subunit)/ligand-binding sensor domain-containing protein
VQTIFQDSSGTIWVGTAGGGLNKFDATGETFIRYLSDPADPASLSNDRIWRMDEDPDGNIWVATSEGLNKFNPHTQQFTRYYHNPASLSNDLIRTLYVDRAGTLWVGTEQGLNRYNPATDDFTVYLNTPNNPQTINDNGINALFEDSQGRFWVGTHSGGLNLLDRATGMFTHYVNNPQDPNSLSYNDIRWIMEDQSGVLWLGTRGGGINKLAPTSGQFTYFGSTSGPPASLNSNDVRAIYEDNDGMLWIGTRSGGLNKYNPATGEFSAITSSTPNAITNNDVLAILKDGSGSYWLGTAGGGVNQFDLKTGTFTAYTHDPEDPSTIGNDDVNVIFEDQSGTLWMGNKGGGLNKFNRQTGQFSRYLNNPDQPTSLSNNDVYALYQTDADSLWVGTYGGGLNRLNLQTDEFTSYRHDAEQPYSISDNNIYSIHQTNDGLMWIATANGGLNQFNLDTQQFSHFGPQQGLASDVIYAILEDNAGNLWLSTNKGLSKFNRDTHQFTNFDTTDGLSRVVYREGSAFKGRDGALYFGGINGLTQFYPEQIALNTHLPPVVLTQFSLFNQPVNLDIPIDQLQRVDLSYRDNMLSFEFAALDFVDPHKNQYAYKLEGFDTDWVYAGNRPFAIYTNLDPGNYTFKVKATNNTGIWNETGTAVSVTITPPFWETWWFRTVAAVGLIALILGIIHVRVKTVEHHRAQLQKEVAERTADLSTANQNLKALNNRLQGELALAKKIQQGLLPPARPNWIRPDIICYSRPAYEVGGDFYDYYAFAPIAGSNGVDRKVALIVGDVSGKGMPAALLMAVSLGSLQSIIGRAPHKEDLVSRMNKTLRPYTQTTNQNCAFCYTELDGDTFSVINAGAIPPFIRRADNSVHWLDATGLPLGVDVELQPAFKGATTTLNPGDTVVMVSDGVIEAMKDSGEMYGFDRLELAIAGGPTNSAEAMLTHLNHQIKLFMGTIEPQDDLTVVIMRV